MNTCRADRLLDDPRALAGAVRRFGAAAGTVDMAVAASLFAQAWAVAVSRPAIAPLATGRRMPDTAAANTVVLLDARHRPAGSAPVTPGYAATAGDTVAGGDPWAEVVADEDAVFAWARARMFDGHLAVLVGVLHGLARVGERLLWGNVAAAVAGGFAALSARPGIATASGPHRLRADAARLLDEPGSPTEGLVSLFPVTRDGVTRLFVRRQTCCLRYRLLDAPPTCLSCRLLPEPDRRRRIGERLAPPVR
jgi:ferric iron reductase protein FhuF